MDTGIQQMILKTGFDKKGYAVEPDRRRAIELAIRVSRADDAVLIAGKGHETYQIIGKQTIDFDDREEARRALNNLNQNRWSKVVRYKVYGQSN